MILYAVTISINYTFSYASDQSTNFSNSTRIANYQAGDEEKRIEQFSMFVTAKLDGIFSTLKTVSENQILKKFDFSADVSEYLHGIPNDIEESKREFLSNVIKENPDIASIFLLLPDGNIYLGEPFADQKQLPRLNFADREWYKGVNLRDSLYMSTVFSSAAINAPAIAVAIPITNSPSNGSSFQYGDVISDKAGYLVAIVDFNYTRELLHKYSEGDKETFYLVDRNGTELINTNNKTYNTELKSFDYKRIINSDIIPNMMTKYQLNDKQGSKLLYVIPMTITGNVWYIAMAGPVYSN